MSEWDPLRRFERERERRYWDPFARLEYERDRRSWDPYYRIEKEIERRYSDDLYRLQRHQERRMGSDWYEAYLENPNDLVLRQKYETLYRSGSANIGTGITSSGTNSGIGINTTNLWKLALGITQQRASIMGIIPPWSLPSMRGILAKNIVNIGIVAGFLGLNIMGYINSPLIVSVIMVFLGLFLRSLPFFMSALALFIFGGQATIDVLRVIGTSNINEVATSLYAKAFMLTLIIAVLASVVSILWNRRRNRRMRERWDKLFTAVLDELREEIERNRSSRSDVGEKKESEADVGKFFELSSGYEE